MDTLNTRYPILFVFFLGTTFTLQAQSLTGEWEYKLTTPDGTTMTNLLVMHDDGTVTIDMNSDGQLDIVSEYTIDGNQVTVRDTDKNSACYDIPGVYSFREEGDKVTLTVVEDECEDRRNGAPTEMTRVE